MGNLFDEVRKLADLENGILPDGTMVKLRDVPEFMLMESKRTVRAKGKKNPKDVWEILRNGTEGEYSALCNCLPEIGGEFGESNAHAEVMKIGKRRLNNAQNYDNLMAGIRGGFGDLFEQFWNETEIEFPAEAPARAQAVPGAVYGK
ncbi:MAG: hypothetical protein FWH48_01640 [Oscillospiraceae bacterium]|nr:hypothetical protein [Oscillospiraceae bacterium]